MKLYNHIEHLTQREQQVLQGLINNYGDYQLMADSLVLEKVTVLSHMNSIFNKLRVKSKTAAAIKALQLGLVELKSHAL